MKKGDLGNAIESRHQLREKLQCKSFEWSLGSQLIVTWEKAPLVVAMYNVESVYLIYIIIYHMIDVYLQYITCTEIAMTHVLFTVCVCVCVCMYIYIYIIRYSY